MRTSAVLSAALLAGSAAAAPSASLSSLLNALVSTVTKDLTTILQDLQIVAATNISAHGAIVPYQSQCPGAIVQTQPGSQRYSPKITWPKGVNGGNFINWKTYKANGVNLGGWLEKEKTHDPQWWDTYAPDAPDEWTFCETLGSQCGPVLEARYASFLNTSTIDQLASVGVNTLRIPTTYAAWIDVPGSQLYHGNQQKYLKTITNYAISKYNMHVIIGLHSLPGGVNNLDIGEALFHDNWFYNSTNLNYSFQAIGQILNFIQASGYTNAFTIAPINEASDNLASFGSSAGLSENASAWIQNYINGAFQLIEAVDTRIPLMLQDCFKGASYWAPLFNSTKNLVMDSHVYYFAAAGSYSEYLLPTVCGQAQYLASSETTFPTFVGEWSLQSLYNNTFAARKGIFDTQRYAWQKYVAGGSFWTAVSYSNATVDGEGDQTDYWSYAALIKQGVITSQTNASYCS